MADILENVNLQHLNTFGLDVKAQYFTEVNSEEEFDALLSNPVFRSSKKLILGGGSNILFTQDFDGLVIRNRIKGISIIQEENDTVYVRAGAGEVWHELVEWCIGKDLSGLENLSLIPGCVGASPMQNIGAYGVEIKDVFSSLEALDMSTGQKKIVSKEECNFGYRESVFKRQWKDRYIIVAVTFALSKTPHFNTSYGAINDELRHMDAEPGIQSISQAVINIRSSKLPDPAKTGNAGSFFKNPEVGKEDYERLKSSYPALVAYVLDNGNYKLAAGWLIEQSGLKGYVQGNAGVHDKQALVLVNRGGATGREIYLLSEYVLQTVFAKFGVRLEREVNII